MNTNRCKMLRTTNKRFEYKCATIGESMFSENKNIFWFGNLHTSYVTECTIKENTMTIKTRNSEYTFELLDGSTFEEFKRTQEEIDELENLCR